MCPFIIRFQNESRTLPVLWHQALLTFVQRYKADISTEQRDALLELLRKQSHPTITPEVSFIIWKDAKYKRCFMNVFFFTKLCTAIIFYRVFILV